MVLDNWLVCHRIIKEISKDVCNRQRKFRTLLQNVHEVFHPEEQISKSVFCQFVIEFLSGTLHVTQILSLITQARITCNTFPAVL